MRTLTGRTTFLDNAIYLKHGHEEKLSGLNVGASSGNCASSELFENVLNERAGS